jgi:two-component system, chemotaxis family, CheB/CheR fusion protein
VPTQSGKHRTPPRQAALAELCRRLVIESYAPTAVLVDHKLECLYSVGPTDRYLHVAPGHPTHDLLAMVRQDMRSKLRSVIQQATREKVRVIVSGGETRHNGYQVAFDIDVQPVLQGGEELLLVCFIDQPHGGQRQGREVREELETTKAELQNALRNLQLSGEEQKAIGEEYQATNEELLTSKDQSQALNEELTTLNTQLQDSLERQRTTSNDLQNILYSTDVATIFLDSSLQIRFFTPATKSLFNVITSDIGRPLADLASLAADAALLADAGMVLEGGEPVEREIQAQNGAWYVRRILPYRAQDGVEGVVITFVDITDRRRISDSLGTAKREAERANLVKSRFLAAASHDLRQPLQTLSLVQGLLANMVQDPAAQKLLTRLDETLGAMSGMLNALLDINQIETGTVQAEIASFPINELLSRLRDEFIYQAQANSLSLRVVPCSLTAESDPRLLEQMIRNLLSNALKYTRRGKVLVGCRRRSGVLSVEVWDTGVGISEEELQAIFEEYHQVDNAARERVRGLGLGLAIVQRLSNLLGHRVSVRSQPGKGSVFTIEVGLSAGAASASPAHDGFSAIGETIAAGRRNGVILVIEDDPEVCELLDLGLRSEGHTAVTAPDGPAAIDLLARGVIRPDLILADYNLPNGIDGLRVTGKLRERLRHQIPAIILTGDISTATSREIAHQDCLQLNKPVKLKELTQVIQRLLPASQAVLPPPIRGPAEVAGQMARPIIFVVDDDGQIRQSIRAVFENGDQTVEVFASCEEFLESYRPHHECCLLIDAYLPGMSGLELLYTLKNLGHHPPAIMITGRSDVSMAVQAMKAGATDFIEKPIGRRELIASVERALEQSRDATKLLTWQQDAAMHLGGLTARQLQIMERVLAGQHSKNIAADLGISQRTVENHRAAIMRKTSAKSLPALARLALAASGGDLKRHPPQAGSPIASTRPIAAGKSRSY